MRHMPHFLAPKQYNGGVRSNIEVANVATRKDLRKQSFMPAQGLMRKGADRMAVFLYPVWLLEGQWQPRREWKHKGQLGGEDSSQGPASRAAARAAMVAGGCSAGLTSAEAGAVWRRGCMGWISPRVPGWLVTAARRLKGTATDAGTAGEGRPFVAAFMLGRAPRVVALRQQPSV